MVEYTPTPEESEAIRVVTSEKANWEDGNVYVTDKVQFVMRNVVKKARKNYFGIYNQQKDPITGRDKIFIPFTEWTVETMLKNIDIDTKDIGVKALTPSAHLKAMVFRKILHKKLDDIQFGKILNQWLRKLAIDGTGFLKAYDEDGLQIRVIDRLNMIYDPSLESFEDSSARIERCVLEKPDFDKLNLENSEYVSTTTTVDHNAIDSSTVGSTSSEVPYVELYIRYGYISEYVRSGNEDDKDKYFNAEIVYSGLESSPVVHSIKDLKEENENPFCVGKLKEIPNRADGRGIPEMLFNIQAYLNEVVNYRMNKARVSQLGLFKMKGNVTPQQFKRLFTTGGIKLDQNADIDMLDTGSIDPSSYKDEDQAYVWGKRVTGTTDDEVSQGNTATEALIEERGVGKGYSLRIEDLMLNLAEFIEKSVIPIIKKELKSKVGEVERITGDPEIIAKLDKEFAKKAVEKMQGFLTPEEKARLEIEGRTSDVLVEETTENIKQELGDDRYLPIIDELLDTEFDIEIVITDESINRSVMASMLQSTMGMLASAGLPINSTLKELYDVLGLDGETLIEDMPAMPPGGAALQVPQSALPASPAQEEVKPGNLL